jgi:hypothetical protein
MPPAIGNWETTSPKTRTTMSWPATTIGTAQNDAPPPVASAYAKSV